MYTEEADGLEQGERKWAEKPPPFNFLRSVSRTASSIAIDSQWQEPIREKRTKEGP